MTEKLTDSLLETLEEIRADTGRIPTRSDIIYYDDALLAEIGSEFQTLERAIEESSINQEEVFIQDIQKVAVEIGKIPTKSEFERHGDHEVDQITSYFGSWSNFREVAEVPGSGDEETLRESDGENAESASSRTDSKKQVERDTSPRRKSSAPDQKDAEQPSKSTIIEELRDLNDENEPFVKPKDVDREASFSSTEVRDVFESWDAALSAAGVDKEQALLEELERVADKLGHLPSSGEMNQHGRVSSTIYDKYFESFATIRDRALRSESNERTNRRSAGTSTQSASRDELLEDLERIKRVINREPTKDDYVRLGNYDIDTVEDRFGNWGSFLGTAEADPAGPDQTTAPDTAIAETTWEDIPDSARLDDPISVEVLDVDRDPGPRKSTVLVVTEPSGRELPVNIWEKHPNPVQWEVGESYLLYNLRGTVWESNGSTRKLLDSTGDIRVKRLDGPPSDRDEEETTDESEVEVDGSDRINSLMDDLDDLL